MSDDIFTNPEIVSQIKQAATDNRLRWKYTILRDRSVDITSSVLNLYGKFGWEIASSSEVLETDQWGNNCYYTSIIFKMPWYHEQEEDSDGQS